MVIKNEDHRQLILELIKQANFPGHILDLAYEVKKEIESADIEKEKK